MSIRDDKITGALKLDRIDVVVVETKVGPLPPETLKLLRKDGLLPLAVEWIVNDVLARGVPLPSPTGTRHVKPTVTLENRTFLFATDLQLDGYNNGS